MAESAPLSERELDIMRRVVTGASNREIAQALDISPNTVKVHLRNIFEKLGVASRTEATIVVLREGWIEVDGFSGDTPAPVVEPGTEGKEEGVVQESSSVSHSPSPVQAAPTVTDGEIAGPAQTAATHRAGSPSRMVLMALGLTTVALLVLVLVLLLRPQEAPVSATNVPDQAVQRWRQLARLPEPRTNATAVNPGQDIYLIGGRDQGGLVSDVWRYDSSTGRWNEIAPLPVPVEDAPAVTIGGEIFVVGGIDAEGQPIATVQRYDLGEESWVAESDALPVPLARAALATFEGQLFLFGGWDGSAVQSTVYRYDRSMEEWEAFATLPAPRANLAAAARQDGIVLVGGTNEAGEGVTDVFHFDPRLDKSFRSETPLPQPENNPRLVPLGNALYLFGSAGLMERDPQQDWNRLTPPQEGYTTNPALVANDPYIILMGGSEGETPAATVWQYQAIYRHLFPYVSDGGK